MTPEQREREMKRELRSVRHELRSLVHVVANSVLGLDAEMKKPSDEERGKRIARICNALELAKDSARHFGLKEKL